MDRLSLSGSQPKIDENGNRVFHEVWITVHGDQKLEIAGGPANKMLADLLFEYSLVFSKYLLRDGRPV
jgi:hypothetical protein